VIHELQTKQTPKRSLDLNLISFDWGSQSIAQCIFQRSLPDLGEREQNNQTSKPRSMTFFKIIEKVSAAQTWNEPR
jgi:hypothetical protein